MREFFPNAPADQREDLMVGAYQMGKWVLGSPVLALRGHQKKEVERVLGNLRLELEELGVEFREQTPIGAA